MEKIKTFLVQWYGVATVAAIALVALNAKLFFVYLMSPVPQGWDGASHFAATLEYSRHVFPSGWGWLTNWHGGTPFPQFYPPLFSMIIATLYKVFFFIHPLVIFKLFVELLQINLLYAIVFTAFQYTKKVWALYTGALVTVVLLCTSSPISNMGITLVSTFQTSMIAQLISGISFLLFVVYLDRAFMNPKYIPHASIFFAGVVLSNAHFIIPVGIYFILSAIYFLIMYKDRNKVFGKIVVIGGSAIALTAFWAFPLMKYYAYLDSYPNFFQPSTHDIVGFWAFPFFIGLAFVIGMIKQESFLIRASLISFFIILAPSFILPILEKFGIVAHVSRWIGMFFLFIPVMIAICYEKIVSFTQNAILNGVVVCAFLVISATSATAWSPYDFNGIYQGYVGDSVVDVTQYLKDHPRNGFLDIEVDATRYQPASFTFNALYGLDTPVDVFNLRESSISAQFLSPIRNSFSINEEAWGFVSYLVHNKRFTQQPVAQSLDRAERVGIQSFLVRSLYARNRLAGDPRIALERDFGKWALYTFKATIPRAYVPEYQPIAFYGPVSFKYRSIADFDWGKLQETLLYYDLPYISFYPNDQYLDTSPELEKSGALFISSYTYHNKLAAEKRILAYAQNHDVVLLHTADPVYVFLQNEKQKNPALRISIVEKQPTVSRDDEQNNLQIVQLEDPVLPELGAVLQKMQLPKAAEHIAVTNTIFTNTSTSIDLASTPKEEVPVLIAQSYFPAWKGAPIYMASPSYTLVFTKESHIGLSFYTPWVVYLGDFVTIITIGCFIFWRKLRSWF